MLPWRADLELALRENRKTVHTRYVQLATVREDGTPANRTLVFRGFYSDSSSLLFVTDSRSSKVQEICHHPVGEACWYFPDTMQQFRFHGRLELIDAQTLDEEKQEERTTLWKTIDNNVRQIVLWPSPGKPRSAAERFENLPFHPGIIPEPFALLLLHPAQVDFLDLISYPHRRVAYILGEDGSWETRAINP